MANAKKRTKAQHFVPQFYLRGFTGETGKLFCYDKVMDKSFPAATSQVAQESFFYEIKPAGGLSIPVNLIEDALARLEAVFAPLHAKLIHDADTGAIPAADIVEFQPFIAVQWLRTKTYRQTLYETAVKRGQNVMDDLIKVNFPDPKPSVVFSINKEAMVAAQASHLLDRDVVLRIADDLDRHLWVVGITDPLRPLYTSDHPVVRRCNVSDWDPLAGGHRPGVEFAYPLDSTHLLLILERTYFAAMKRHNNKSIRLTPEQVRDYNGLQVRQSGQRVFCRTDDFDLAREVCTAEPAVRDPNRQRVTVESTPLRAVGNEIKNYMITLARE